MSNAMTATPPIVERLTSSNARDGVSTEIIQTVASVRTTVISHAENAASGMSGRCTGSNMRDGKSIQPTSRKVSAPNAPKCLKPHARR